MGSSNSWNPIGYADVNLSTAARWTDGLVGGRMDRQLSGSTTIGGRGANRTFRGKVAAMTITTLRRGVAMPSSDEISMLIRDPKQWLLDYKQGQPYRLPYSQTEATFALSTSGSAYATQVWLMGDGQFDA